VAEVVYLKQGERAPRRGKSAPYLLIVCRRRGGEVAQTGADGALQTIRTSPEHVADILSGFLGKGLKIYVQGVPSSAEVESEATDGRRRPRPTIEDLDRENEIRASLDDKLRSTAEILMQFDAAPHHHDSVTSSVRGLIADYLAAAPHDAYGQRRAMEILHRGLPTLNAAGAVQRAVLGIVLPSLFDLWKRDR
jgi:hypothetical protein